MSSSYESEEIYDFDDLFDKDKETARRGATYTVDKDGPRSRPLFRPKVNQDNTVRLPPVLVGRNLTTTVAHNMAVDRRVKVSASVQREMDWDRERKKLHGPRQPQKENAFTSNSRDKLRDNSGMLRAGSGYRGVHEAQTRQPDTRPMTDQELDWECEKLLREIDVEIDEANVKAKEKKHSAPVQHVPTIQSKDDWEKECADITRSVDEYNALLRKENIKRQAQPDKSMLDPLPPMIGKGTADISRGYNDTTHVPAPPTSRKPGDIPGGYNIRYAPGPPRIGKPPDSSQSYNKGISLGYNDTPHVPAPPTSRKNDNIPGGYNIRYAPGPPRIGKPPDSSQSYNRGTFDPAPPNVKKADDPMHSYSNTYVPAPPTSGKPNDSSQSYSKNRRRLRYSNQEMEQDISVHKLTTTQSFQPKPPTSVEIEYELEVIQALKIQKDLERLHQKISDKEKAVRLQVAGCVVRAGLSGDEALAAMDKTEAAPAAYNNQYDDLDNFLNSDELFRPTTAAAANCNLAGPSTPYMAAPMVPHKSSEPLRQWNGDTAKRGLGFKSKLNREEKKSKTSESSIIPDSVRKQMKKYNFQ